MNTTAIAQQLNILDSAIIEIQEWANVLWVRFAGGCKFVSKKVIAMIYDDSIQECLEIASVLNSGTYEKTDMESLLDSWAINENQILTGGWKVPIEENSNLIDRLESQGFASASAGNFRQSTGRISFQVGNYWIESYGKGNDKLKFSKMLSREDKEKAYLQMAVESARVEKESGYLAD